MIRRLLERIRRLFRRPAPDPAAEAVLRLCWQTGQPVAATVDESGRVALRVGQGPPLPFQEFRPDGWPYCPRCGHDELYSDVAMAWNGRAPRPTLEECLSGGFGCYFCAWRSP